MAAMIALSRVQLLGVSPLQVPSVINRGSFSNCRLSLRERGGCNFAPSALVADRRRSGIARASAERRQEGTMATATAEEVVAGVIVGAGRVGQALASMGGGRDVVVRRGESVPEESTGPIFVCTRNDVLGAIVDATPASRREDLVFIQNGMLEPWLESKGLRDATQVLVYFAVAKLGDPPLDGKTDTNPEGLTTATGKWAAATAKRLYSAGLSCKVLDAEEFKKPMLEKLIWICAFMLVGARHPGATVGVVEKEHNDEVADLINELAGAAAAEMQTEFDAGIVDRLCAYARSVAHFPTAVKEFQWRNGWFYEISRRALESGKEDPCPLHTKWLKELGVIKS